MNSNIKLYDNNNIQPYNGLHNFGNSCYFNSSIQFLKSIFDTIISSSHELSDDIVKILFEYYEYYYNQNHLLNKYQYICKKIHSNFGQQDSDEAILTIIDDIMSSLNSSSKEIFNIGIKYQHLITCSRCNKFKICNDGNKQIENVIISKYLSTHLKSTNEVPFNKLLGNMLNKEYADDEIIKTFKKEQSCNCDNVGITIQTVLTDVPKFLIVYINRCLYDRQHKLNGKIQIASKFEITTPSSLEDRCANKPYHDISHKYALYGIIIHTGNTRNSGHYYTYSKNHNTNVWYMCNDKSVHEVENFDPNDSNIQSNCSALLYIKNN